MKPKPLGIAAALELGIRRNATNKKKDHIARSIDIADYLRATLESKKQEVFAVVFSNRGNRATHLEIISQNGMTGTVADPRMILKKALDHDATAIVLCHNHPSKNVRPSRADELLTQKIKQAAAFFDLYIMDHIIISMRGILVLRMRGCCRCWMLAYWMLDTDTGYWMHRYWMQGTGYWDGGCYIK